MTALRNGPRQGAIFSAVAASFFAREAVAIGGGADVA
jgi:hypothetical protein